MLRYFDFGSKYPATQGSMPLHKLLLKENEPGSSDPAEQALRSHFEEGLPGNDWDCWQFNVVYGESHFGRLGTVQIAYEKHNLQRGSTVVPENFDWRELFMNLAVVSCMKAIGRVRDYDGLFGVYPVLLPPLPAHIMQDYWWDLAPPRGLQTGALDIADCSWIDLAGWVEGTGVV